MTKAILLAMIVETILIIFIMKGMPCRSSHTGSSRYASFNAIYTNWFISTPRCNLGQVNMPHSMPFTLIGLFQHQDATFHKTCILEVKQELFLLLLVCHFKPLL